MVITDPLWQLTLALFFALLFITTAWHKWQDMHHTASVVAKYRLVPITWCYVIAYAVATAEVLAVLLLWLIPTLGAVLIIALLMAYSVAISINLQRGRTRMDCGCGGVPIRLTPLLLVRNLLLIAFVGLLLVPVDVRLLTWVDKTLGIVTAMTFFVLYVTTEQLLSNHRQHVVS